VRVAVLSAGERAADPLPGRLAAIGEALSRAGHEVRTLPAPGETSDASAPVDVLLFEPPVAAAAVAEADEAALTVCYHGGPETPVADGPAHLRLAATQAIADDVAARTGQRAIVVEASGDGVPAREVAAILERALAERRLVLPSPDEWMETEVRTRFSSPVTVEPLAGDPPPASIVVLSWDQLHYTRDCIASIRARTPEPYELVIVDNGSRDEVAAWVQDAADVAVLNPANRGVARALNQGAAVASGEVLVFLNNDTRVPGGWLTRLHEALAVGDDIGLVAAATTAGTAMQRRRAAGVGLRAVHPFSDYVPAGVCYALRREVLDAAGGWRETEALVASEDYELCFTLWALGYRVLVDDRVLIEHVSEGTSGVKLDDWIATYTEAGEGFLERWLDPEHVPAPERFPGGPFRALRRCLDRIEVAESEEARRSLRRLRAAVEAAERLALADRRAAAVTTIDLMARRDPRRPGAPWGRPRPR
jgi:glycosyltransferase involved in cell wall biosynthesis